MKVRLSTALEIALIALSAGVATRCEAGPCRHQTSHNCFRLPPTLNFSSVPDISDEIVKDEPAVRPPPKPAVDAQPSPEPYTGPMIGVNSHLGAPTVGYYWSIH